MPSCALSPSPSLSSSLPLPLPRLGQLRQPFGDASVIDGAVRVPFRVRNIGHFAENNVATCIQSLQAKCVKEVDRLRCHLPHYLVNIIEGKHTGFPGRDDPVIWASDQDQLADTQKVSLPCTCIGVKSLIIQYSQKIAIVEVKISMMWVIPVVTDGDMLTQMCVAEAVEV